MAALVELPSRATRLVAQALEALSVSLYTGDCLSMLKKPTAPSATANLPSPTSSVLGPDIPPSRAIHKAGPDRLPLPVVAFDPGFARIFTCSPAKGGDSRAPGQHFLSKLATDGRRVTSLSLLMQEHVSFRIQLIHVVKLAPQGLLDDWTFRAQNENERNQMTQRSITQCLG
ncbi:uncharacterized protein MAM_06121 [Metarhizium album ARSEF 1941]|uniref:Uncharacterized protein n=1 Tax=Metarhizium album (strain ARSEF 1941) TaxID=1081103 RepID=A0A0B2WIY9_METAS|nr:uncharacterized protein MAM_06121 [Metarhizium album ARSEF 1941]KHN96016.1 hypothetical protein MAM_06121 [Metarhizium album ARSEF 1941]